VDSLSKCEFLEDIAFGNNRGIGNCFWDYDSNSKFFGKTYDLLLKSCDKYIHINISSIASGEDFDINDYYDILESIEIKSEN
jgi:hypothetical protein